MADHLLLPGTLLDERYRIDSVLGEGGFGVTYAAQNVRIGLKVAIKELFWRGHCARDISVSQEVQLLDAADEAVFQEQKQRFLREARTIRDFSSLPGVAHILDYFEANATAYIVMEYVEGENLAAHLKSAGVIPAEKLFRLFLPLVDSLGSIHAGGVIHRDISPDNIMVQPDGSLKLIDFGAARAWKSDDDAKYTTIAKDSYAPGEQYDKNGKQGPWTDVYALCATMYACLTGVAPVSAVQRLFLDELKAPSQMGTDIATPYESILMRGLEMNAAKRYASMEELAQAMRAALPQPKAEQSHRRSVLLGMLAALLCVAAVLGVWSYRQYDAANKFRGIETEEIRLNAPEDMTAAEFSRAQDELKARLDEFAGEDNYLIDVDGTEIRVLLPLDCFNNEEISARMRTLVAGLTEGNSFDGFQYEMQVLWEDPGKSAIAGENQVLPDAFDCQTAIFAYTWSGDLTQGQRANLIMDFKVRLDALGAPYAFGTLYGDENVIAFQIDPQYVNTFILNSIGKGIMYIASEISDWKQLYLAHNKNGEDISIVEYDDGTYGLRYEFDADSYDGKGLKAAVASAGNDALYLESSGELFPCSIAQASLAEALETGAIEFRTFRFDGVSTVTEENRWIVDYVDAVLNRTELPANCYMWNYELMDEAGNAVFNVEDIKQYYGRPGVEYKPSDKKLLETLIRLTEETGYVTTASKNAGTAWVNLCFDVDDQLVENIANTVPALLEEYGFRDLVLNCSVVFYCVDEQEGELCRIAVGGGWDNENNRYMLQVSPLYYGEGRLEAYNEEFYRWFHSMDWEAMGFAVDDWLDLSNADADSSEE